MKRTRRVFCCDVVRHGVVPLNHAYLYVPPLCDYDWQVWAISDTERGAAEIAVGMLEDQGFTGARVDLDELSSSDVGDDKHTYMVTLQIKADLP